ncbi:MAG: hypothetical protein CMM95_02145 [Rickettsiales bacterium]|nr:hypothetical protein [Rickettsiales bacterium]
MTIESLKRLFIFDEKNFIPIKFKKFNIGWIHKKNTKVNELFNLKKKFIEISEITEKLKKKKIANQLIEKKFKEIEFCPVFKREAKFPRLNFNHNECFGKNSFFNIQRSLLSIFGFPQYGVHCNAWSRKNGNTFFHLAKRSRKLDDFPGLYDNLIGGGQPTGISIIQNLEKEAFEEAGLKKKSINKWKRGNTINYFHNHKNSAFFGIIFVYDLKIIEKSKFINMDGEVEKFDCFNVDEIYKILEKKMLKPNSIIPIADFFLRKMSDYFPQKGILEIKRILKK